MSAQEPAADPDGVPFSGRVREKPWLLLVAFLVGAGVATAGTFADRWIGKGWSPEAVAFADRPQTLLWLALAIAAGGVWAALGSIAAVVLAPQIGGKSRAKMRAGLLLVGVLLLAVVGLGTTIEPDHPLPGRTEKLWLFAVLGAGATLPCVLAIWRVHQVADTLRPTVGVDDWKHELSVGVGGAPDPDVDHPVEALMRLRELLDRSLVLLGSMLGMAIASIGAFRHAVVSWEECKRRIRPAPEEQCGTDGFSASTAVDFLGVPIEYVLLHGMCFSLLLALIYVPAYLRLQALGRAVVDHLVPIDIDAGARPVGAAQSAAPAAVTDRVEERQSLLTVLQLNAGVTSSLTAGASILTPLVASFAGLLLSTS